MTGAANQIGLPTKPFPLTTLAGTAPNAAQPACGATEEGSAPREVPRAARWSRGRIGRRRAACLARLAFFDLALVRLIANAARSRLPKALAIAVSRSGNGGIYAVLLVAVLVRSGSGAFSVITLAGCNAAVLHVVYPALKRQIARRRPFAVDRRVSCRLAVLDEHSFPSGHVMTLAAVLVPIVYIDPGFTWFGAALVLVMGWGRIATGHHFPSDVLAGAFIGAALGYPLTVTVFGQF